MLTAASPPPLCPPKLGKNKKLRYDPEYVYAKKGDIVLFEYL